MTRLIGLSQRSTWNFFQNFFSVPFSRNDVLSAKIAISCDTVLCIIHLQLYEFICLLILQVQITLDKLMLMRNEDGEAVTYYNYTNL